VYNRAPIKVKHSIKGCMDYVVEQDRLLKAIRSDVLDEMFG
jgi:hypothetical protein